MIIVLKNIKIVSFMILKYQSNHSYCSIIVPFLPHWKEDWKAFVLYCQVFIASVLHMEWVS